MKKIVLGNASINEGNRGCVALSYCAIYLIDKVFDSTGYKLYLTDSHEGLGGHSISVDGKTIRYESILIPRYNTLKGLAKSFVFLKSSLSGLKILKKADLVMDIGQGDSFSDIYGCTHYDSIDFIHILSRHFKKPYIFLPQTIGPFKDNIACEKAIKSLSKSSMVMVRDKASYEYVKKICPSQNNVREYLDVAFVLPYNRIDFDKGYTHVGLNVSALLWNGGYTKNNQFNLACDYKELIRNIIDFFLQQSNTKVHLIPHVVLQERNIENDYEICYDLWRNYSNSNLLLAPFPLDPIEIKSYIAGMDFFMGARMHATIAAYSANVPVVPMAYSRKFNGLFEDTLSYPHVVDLKSAGNKEALLKIEEIFIQREEVKQSITNTMNGIVKDRLDMLVKDLKSLLI